MSKVQMLDALGNTSGAGGNGVEQDCRRPMTLHKVYLRGDLACHSFLSITLKWVQVFVNAIVI